MMSSYVLECLHVGYTRRPYRSPVGWYASLDKAMAAVKTYGAAWRYDEWCIGKYRYPQWMVAPFGKPFDNHAWYRITPEDWKR
jgi:hypothetical protein